ncbi:MAG: POTRA domain-containing protein, partial [candidate division WOR-3 bacterium]
MTTLTTIFFNSANGAVIDNVKKNDDLYQIRLKGNKALPQLAKLTKIPRTIVLNDSLINEINNILLSEYSKNGYFWTKITIDTNIRKKQVVFNITENKPAMIAKVEFQGNEQIPTSKLSRFIKTDATFSQSVLTNQLNAVLRYYQNNGLPFANVEPINFVLNEENKRVSYTLKINEGK